MPEAVSWTLSLQRQIIAARLEVAQSEVEVVAAKLWPNPELSYSIGNLVLGAGNDQERDLKPSFGAQTIQAVGLEQSFDIWRRRWARLQSAKADVRVAKCRLADALREVVYAARSAFLEAAREEREYALACANADHWHTSAQLMARRLKAGDIAQADLAKIELEALRAKNAAIAARAELEQARQGLAARMGLMDPLLLPQHLTLPQRPAQQIQAVEALMATALHQRPDLAAVGAQMERADAEARLASREALPDVRLGVSYSRSHFMISGDNPHTLGFNVGVPLPVLDRNQPGRARAQLARQQARNDQGLLRIEVQRQVSQAVSRLQRAQAGLACFEGEGMLQKAERARSVAHRALSNGAFSLLDVLEAERTALEVQAEHLAMQYALHQAFVDIAYVTAQESL